MLWPCSLFWGIGTTYLKFSNHRNQGDADAKRVNPGAMLAGSSILSSTVLAQNPYTPLSSPALAMMPAPTNTRSRPMPGRG